MQPGQVAHQIQIGAVFRIPGAVAAQREHAGVGLAGVLVIDHHAVLRPVLVEEVGAAPAVSEHHAIVAAALILRIDRLVQIGAELHKAGLALEGKAVVALHLEVLAVDAAPDWVLFLILVLEVLVLLAACAAIIPGPGLLLAHALMQLAHLGKAHLLVDQRHLHIGRSRLVIDRYGRRGIGRSGLGQQRPVVVVAHLQELGFARVAGGGGTREYRLSMGIADSHHRLVGNLGLFGLRHIAEDAARHGNRGASGSTAVDGQAVCRQAVGIVPSAVHQQFRSALAGVVAVDGQAVDGIGIVGVQVDGAGVGHIARDGGGAARCQGAAAVDGKPHGVACCVSARASGKCAIQRQLGALVELDDLPVDDGRAVGGGGHAIEVEGVDLAVGDRGVVTAIKHLRAVVLGGGNGQGVRASATLHAAEAGRAAPLHGVVAIATVDDSCDGGSSGHGERVVAFTADYAALDGAGLHGDDVIAQTAIDIAADAAGGVDGDGVARVFGSAHVDPAASAQHIASH